MSDCSAENATASNYHFSDDSDSARANNKRPKIMQNLSKEHNTKPSIKKRKRSLIRKSPVLNTNTTGYHIAKEWIADILKDHKGSLIILIPGDNNDNTEIKKH